MGRPGPRGKRSWITDSKQYWPLEVAVPGGRVVELAAGGWYDATCEPNSHGLAASTGRFLRLIQTDTFMSGVG